MKDEIQRPSTKFESRFVVIVLAIIFVAGFLGAFKNPLVKVSSSEKPLIHEFQPSDRLPASE